MKTPTQLVVQWWSIEPKSYVYQCHKIIFAVVLDLTLWLFALQHKSSAGRSLKIIMFDGLPSGYLSHSHGKSSHFIAR